MRLFDSFVQFFPIFFGTQAPVLSCSECIRTCCFAFYCDAMMHVLKDFINLKYSELLTEEISKSN